MIHSIGDYCPLCNFLFAEILKDKTATECEAIGWRLLLTVITAFFAYFSFFFSTHNFDIVDWVFNEDNLLFLGILSILIPIFLLLIEYLFFFLLFRSRKHWKATIFTFFIKTIFTTVSLLVSPFCDNDFSLFVGFVTGAASSLYFYTAIFPFEDLRIIDSLFSLFLSYMVYFSKSFIFKIVLVLFYVDSWQKSMIHFTSFSSSNLQPSAFICDSNSTSNVGSSELVNPERFSSTHHKDIDILFPRSDGAYTTIVDGSESLMLQVDITTFIYVKDDGPKRSVQYTETANIQWVLINAKEIGISNTSINVELGKSNIEMADNIQVPNFLIDENSDPDATILYVGFVNRLGALIDAMRILEDFRLDVVKVTVATEGSVTWAAFFVSHMATGQKVEDHNILNKICLTISNNLLEYDQELSKQHAQGEVFGSSVREKKLDVDTTTLIHGKDEGSKKMRAVSCLPYSKTADLRVLLLELINKYISNTNINVESREIDAECSWMMTLYPCCEQPDRSPTNRVTSEEVYGFQMNGGVGDQPIRCEMKGRATEEPDGSLTNVRVTELPDGSLTNVRVTEEQAGSSTSLDNRTVLYWYIVPAFLLFLAYKRLS